MMKHHFNPEYLVGKELICIDPGKGGAIVKYNSKIEIIKMPEFEPLCDYMAKQKETCENPLIFLEKVQLWQGDDNNKKGEKSGKQFMIQKMLNQYSELLAAIKVNKLRYIEIHPITWQSYLKIKIGGEERYVRKKRYCDIARDKYPSLKVTMQNCDALLIVEFARLKLKYDVQWVISNIKNEKTY